MDYNITKNAILIQSVFRGYRDRKLIKLSYDEFYFTSKEIEKKLTEEFQIDYKCEINIDMNKLPNFK
jgi:hypothetical protein